MTESTFDVPTADGAMGTRLFREGDAPRPTVLFFMDGLGVRDVLVRMARRLASHGYAVVLPNLFYRAGAFEPFDGKTVFTTPSERERLMALIREVTPSRVQSDIRALVAALERQPGVGANRLGTVGYCMGGGPALAAAGLFPDRVFAAASYHGGRLATDDPDSPHRWASRAKGAIYVGYAENDTSFPDEQRARLEEALSAAKVRYAMERYHAAHGFAIEDLPAYDPAAAARHWDTLLAFFREHLHA